MYGKIVIQPELSVDGQSELPVLYFDNGIAYLISFRGSKVSKAAIQQDINKDIDIVGELKIGIAPSQFHNY